MGVRRQTVTHTICFFPPPTLKTINHTLTTEMVVEEGQQETIGRRKRCRYTGRWNLKAGYLWQKTALLRTCGCSAGEVFEALTL